MRLFQMEVYKLLHKKAAIVSGTAVIILLVLFFWINVEGQETVVHKQHYKGLEAVKKDREITESFRGILTDQKINEIVDTYGFPSEVEWDYGYWRDGNYLTAFVTEYFSDGYFNGWEEGEYKIPEHTVPIARSELGRSAAKVGKEISFGYSQGYDKFEEYCQIGMIMAAVWAIIVVSPLFAEEFRLKTNALIFTTEHGKKHDITAKIAAGFFVMSLAYLWVVLSGLLLYGSVYGFEGGNMLNGIILRSQIEIYHPLTYATVQEFMLLYLFFLFIGMLMTVSLSIWASSRVKSVYHAVVISLLLITVPFLLFLLFHGRLTDILFYLMPVGNMMRGVILENGSYLGVMEMILAAAIVFGCIFSGWRQYRKAEGV